MEVESWQVQQLPRRKKKKKKKKKKSLRCNIPRKAGEQSFWDYAEEEIFKLFQARRFFRRAKELFSPPELRINNYFFFGPMIGEGGKFCPRDKPKNHSNFILKKSEESNRRI